MGWAATVHVVAAVILTLSRFIAGEGIAYDTSAGVVDGKLNVHLVAHTHDDVGWLKTVDQYYVGSNNSIQEACVRDVLNSVVDALHKNPDRKFIYVEQAFFQRWWSEQRKSTQETVRKLVDSGQLEFINGGWCMHDEAATHYIDMIDQTTLGHRMIKRQFNKVPRTGWQIDPFGHSAVQSYLLSAELGFDSVHFSRIDYQDKLKRSPEKSLEVIWRGSKTLGSSVQVFANVFPAGYAAPAGFVFEVLYNTIPVQDNHLLDDYNVEQRVNDFIDAAIIQANITRTNHIMWTMGEDFMYEYAETWFKEMDKLIHYVNKDGRINALYSTPTIYVDAQNAANQTWPLKFGDFFPYADSANAYWTGYYTSRPAFKRYVRVLSGYYLAARQLELFVGRSPSGPTTSSLGDALGIAQHHDAVSGTAKQHTTDDYAKRLAFGAAEAESVVSSAVSCITSSDYTCLSSLADLSQCNLLNISYCPQTEAEITDGKNLIVVLYNSLGWNRTDFIRIPVNDNQLSIQDSRGKAVEAQFIELDNVTCNIRTFYVKAYMGISSGKCPKYWLVFQVSVPAIGWSTYTISKASASSKSHELTVVEQDSDIVEVGPGDFKMSFSKVTGILTRAYNSKTGVDVTLNQSYLWYASRAPSNIGDPQASGAYIFRPIVNIPSIVTTNVSLHIIRGPLVHEVHQQFSSWINQVTRLYKDEDYAEVEFTVGPIPINDGVGKEVISRFSANLATNKTFYTDSNGRDFLKRVRDHRDDWDLKVTQPVAGNYYPVNLGIYMEDGETELSILVDRAVGGSSIHDGQLEIMLHRRLLFDDKRGVQEALDETVCVGVDCPGLTTRGNYYLNIDKANTTGARWRRTVGQHIYSPLLLAFAHESVDDWKSSHVLEGTAWKPGYNLPPNVALITLEELDDGVVLLRLAHLYEAGEDDAYSTLARVDLDDIFSGKTIKKLTETNLSANQVKSEMKKLKWRIEGDGEASPEPLKGSPVDGATHVVELGPMEIRTFLIKF